MPQDAKRAEIHCPICGKVTLVIRRPRYDGLRKVGEILSCSVCLTEFAGEANVKFVDQEKPHVFREEDGVRLCLNCKHYIVNPFVQRCTLTMREVEATDSCARFVLRPKPKQEEEKKEKSPDELRRLLGLEQEKAKEQNAGGQKDSTVGPFYDSHRETPE
ncbi:MAG: hypothetical protein Q8Q12_18435 [bacterium]|nr:hypothetical protein [bacterium]